MLVAVAGAAALVGVAAAGAEVRRRLTNKARIARRLASTGERVTGAHLFRSDARTPLPTP
jgi:hypothetical protein